VITPIFGDYTDYFVSVKPRYIQGIYFWVFYRNCNAFRYASIQVFMCKKPCLPAGQAGFYRNERWDAAFGKRNFCQAIFRSFSGNFGFWFFYCKCVASRKAKLSELLFWRLRRLLLITLIFKLALILTGCAERCQTLQRCKKLLLSVGHLKKIDLGLRV
jgi:hypothetical protein